MAKISNEAMLRRNGVTPCGSSTLNGFMAEYISAVKDEHAATLTAERAAAKIVRNRGYLNLAGPDGKAYPNFKRFFADTLEKGGIQYAAFMRYSKVGSIRLALESTNGEVEKRLAALPTSVLKGVVGYYDVDSTGKVSVKEEKRDEYKAFLSNVNGADKLTARAIESARKAAAPKEEKEKETARLDKSAAKQETESNHVEAGAINYAVSCVCEKDGISVNMTPDTMRRIRADLRQVKNALDKLPAGTVHLLIHEIMNGLNAVADMVDEDYTTLIDATGNDNGGAENE